MKLLGLWLAVASVALGAVVTIQEAGTLTTGSGAPVNGQISITPTVAFLAADGNQVAMTPVVAFVVNGFLNVQLEANDTGLPALTRYVVVYTLKGGGQYTETWNVTGSGTKRVSDVRVATGIAPGYVVQLSQLGQGGASSNQVIGWNGFTWGPVAPGGAGAVGSVFGRTGAVVASSGDYTAAQVTNAVAGTGTLNQFAYWTSGSGLGSHQYITRLLTGSTYTPDSPVLGNALTGATPGPGCGLYVAHAGSGPYQSRLVYDCAPAGFGLYEVYFNLIDGNGHTAQFYSGGQTGWVASGFTIGDAVLGGLADVTTGDASITKHGLLKKLPNNSLLYLDGTGTFSTPAGGGGGGIAPSITDTFANLGSHTCNGTTAGQFFYASDSDDGLVAVCDGVSAWKWKYRGIAVTPPTTATFTTNLNFGGSTAAQANASPGVVFTGGTPGTGSSTVIRGVLAPFTKGQTVIAGMIMTMSTNSVEVSGCGLTFYDGSGRILSIAVMLSYNNLPTLELGFSDTFAIGTAGAFRFTGGMGGTPVWFKILPDATNFKYATSFDGKRYTNMAAGNWAGTMGTTPTGVGPFCTDQTQTPPIGIVPANSVHVIDWSVF